jgi:hypothetical protein
MRPQRGVPLIGQHGYAPARIDLLFFIPLSFNPTLHSTMTIPTIPDILKHPLQRLKSPSRTLSLAWHVIGIGSFLNSFQYLRDHPNKVNQSYGWHFQHLTILGTSPLC